VIRRITVEFLAPAELARPDVTHLLLPRRVAPMLALPAGGDDLAALAALQPYVTAGLDACAWPLLPDDDGYWPGVANAARFVERVRSIVALAERNHLHLPRLAVDLEPPVGAVLRLARTHPLAAFARLVRDVIVPIASRAAFDAAAATYAALQQELLRSSTRTLAIAYPFAAADFARVSRRCALQRMVEAPLRAGWDAASVLAFGSMLSGLSRGALDAADARWYAHRALSQLARAFPGRAAAFVGLVGKGKLGDEPSYADPLELARDVASARAAGVDDLALYGLEGVLQSSNPGAWLDALVTPPPAAPPLRLRGELLHRSMNLAALVLPG
jgi:hypothetical protein